MIVSCSCLLSKIQKNVAYNTKLDQFPVHKITLSTFWKFCNKVSSTETNKTRLESFFFKGHMEKLFSKPNWNLICLSILKTQTNKHWSPTGMMGSFNCNLGSLNHVMGSLNHRMGSLSLNMGSLDLNMGSLNLNMENKKMTVKIMPRKLFANSKAWPTKDCCKEIPTRTFFQSEVGASMIGKLFSTDRGCWSRLGLETCLLTKMISNVPSKLWGATVTKFGWEIFAKTGRLHTQ